MATLVIENPTNLPEAADTGYMRQNTQAYAARTGFLLAGINNMENTAAPGIQGGTVFEMNGTLYKTAANEGIGGNLAGGKNYVYAVPNEGGAAFQYSTAAPAWNTPKGGWYNGNNRAVLRFDYAGGAFNDKVLMDEVDYDADLKTLKLIELMKKEFEEALGDLSKDLGDLSKDLGELGKDLTGLGEALTEGLKKMAGFDIPPDSAARTLVYSRTSQGEGSVTLAAGIYEVRMRGGKGGNGGVGYVGGGHNGAGEAGVNGGHKGGFFKVSSGNRVVYVNVGGGGGNGSGSTGGTGGYNDGGSGGNSAATSGGSGGSGGRGDLTEGHGRNVTIAFGGNGGEGGSGHNGESSEGGMSYIGGGGGGGGGSSSISEQLQLSGGRAPAGTGGAVEIYRVAV